MTLYELPNMSGGIDDALIGTASAVPAFTPMLLIFVFATVLLGGILSQKRRMGVVDFPLWTTIASLSTFMTALPLTLATGLIDLTTLSIVVAITIFSGIWFFTSHNRNEV